MRLRPLLPAALCLLLLGAAPSPWTAVEPGLDLGVFDSPTKSDVGDSKIRVLRIDPERFELVLLNASADPLLGNRTARQWVETENLVAAINPSMYGADHKTSVAHMERDGHVNNRRWSKDNDVLAFDPVDPTDPPVTIIDSRCDDRDSLAPRYKTLIQSIRMLRCDGVNVWSQQDKRWSHAVVGIDGAGRALFIHARSPWSTHDFIDLLMALPLDLKRLQYAEGGPEASLYVRAGSTELDQFGSYETGFYESDDNDRAWPLPNVLGVRRAAR